MDQRHTLYAYMVTCTSREPNAQEWGNRKLDFPHYSILETLSKNAKVEQHQLAFFRGVNCSGRCIAQESIWPASFSEANSYYVLLWPTVPFTVYYGSIGQLSLATFTTNLSEDAANDANAETKHKQPKERSKRVLKIQIS